MAIGSLSRGSPRHADRSVGHRRCPRRSPSIAVVVSAHRSPGRRGHAHVRRPGDAHDKFWAPRYGPRAAALCRRSARARLCGPARLARACVALFAPCGPRPGMPLVFSLLGPSGKRCRGPSPTRCADKMSSLIAEQGFTAVAVEADWPDAYRVVRRLRLDQRAVDQVPCDEWNTHARSHTATGKWIKGTRWSPLESPEQTVPQLALLGEVQHANKPVFRAFLLKEELRLPYQLAPLARTRAPRRLARLGLQITGSTCSSNSPARSDATAQASSPRSASASQRPPRRPQQPHPPDPATAASDSTQATPSSPSAISVLPHHH